MISPDPMNIVGIVILFIFLGLMLGFTALDNRWQVVLRPIAPYKALREAMERAVEAGERVHVSLGTGSITGPDCAPALAGLSILSRVAAATRMSDKPVIVTASDGAMVVLAQDTLRTSYERVHTIERYDPTSARLLGPTPFSYAAGLPSLMRDEGVSVNMFLGSFGSEAGLAAEFGRRQQDFVLAGTDHLQSQALFYVTAEQPLIGEELFAGGAYLNVGPMHRASLRAQDTVRWLVIVILILGTLLKTLGVSW